MRWAGPEDLEDVWRHLEAHSDWAMFPIDNLRRYGLNGDAPRSMRFLMDDQALLPISTEGMMFPLPHGRLDGVRAQLVGERIVGAVGQADAVASAIEEIGASEAETFQTGVEPFMVLDLAELRCPTGDTFLVSTKDILQETLFKWRVDFRVEHIGETVEKAHMNTKRDMSGWEEEENMRVLCDSDGPVALTGFTAVHRDSVLVGGVYTPPVFRNRGFARRAVGLHLEDARAAGKTRAVLSAGSAAAVKAYQSLGFRIVDRACMTLFKTPFEVRA